MPRPVSFRARAAIFDVDGVLATTAPLHLESWRRTAEEFRLPLSRDVVEILRGVDRKASVEAIAAAAEAPLSDGLKAEIAARKNFHYLALIRALSPADAFDGARDALESCKARGLAIAIASSSLNAPLVLERLDLMRYVDAIADPAAVARGKPDPELLFSAAKLIDTATAACVGLDDSVPGVTAIKAAGMFALGVGDGEKLIATGADETIPAIRAFDVARYC